MAVPLELDDELLELDELELEELLELLLEELLDVNSGCDGGSLVSSPPQAVKKTQLASASTRVRITLIPHDHFYYGFLRCTSSASICNACT